MPTYPDKRNRYAGRAPWAFAAGIPRGDNPVPTKEPTVMMAERGSAPRDGFRISTTEDETMLLAQAEAEEIKKRQDEHKANQNFAFLDSSSDGTSEDSTVIVAAKGDDACASVQSKGNGTGSGATVGSSASSILATDD